MRDLSLLILVSRAEQAGLGTLDPSHPLRAVLRDRAGPGRSCEGLSLHHRHA
jgi:hypothetical protein